jgi:hypothetical protein
MHVPSIALLGTSVGQRAAASLAATISLAASTLAISSTAVAQVDPSVTTPTGYYVLLGATEAQVNTYRGYGYRIIDIDRVAANSFDAVLVQNSGDYANSGETWFAGATEATISGALAGKRLIDLQPFESGGSTLHTAVLVSNAGDDAVPGWGWLYAQTSTSAIDTWTDDNNLRAINLQRYTIGGATRWSGVAVSNSGAAAASSLWSWGRTPAQIVSLVNANPGFLTDVEVATQGGGGVQPTFNVVQVNKPIRGWWYHYGLDSTQILEQANALGARPIDVERYTDANGATKFFVVYVDNTNALESRIRALIDPATDSTYGFYLKEVGGPVLAQLNADFPAEIASTMKFVHAVREVQRASQGLEGPLGLDSIVYNSDTMNPDECPDGNASNAVNEPIRNVLWRMLNQSDNNATLLIANRCGGNAALTSWLGSNGIAGVTLNHTLGCLCGNTPNTGPARGICSLYEKAATNQFFNEAWEEQLWDVMFGSNTFGTGHFSAMITEEAAGLGLSIAELNEFRWAFWYRYKDGGYGCNSDLWGGIAGIVRIPFKQIDGTIVPREYVGMTFGHDGTNIAAVYANWAELYRERIRAALESWAVGCNTPVFVNFPQSQSVPAGQVATFTAVAEANTGITYRWLRNGVEISNGGAYSGATSTTLSVTAGAAVAGTYTCRASTTCASKVSTPAQLTVLPAPCTEDIDGDGTVGASDLSLLLVAWGTAGGAADLDGNGTVGASDLSQLLVSWGACG